MDDIGTLELVQSVGPNVATAKLTNDEIIEKCIARIVDNGAITQSSFFEAIPMLMEIAETLGRSVDKEEWVVNLVYQVLEVCITQHNAVGLVALRPTIRAITPAFVRNLVRATKGRFDINVAIEEIVEAVPSGGCCGWFRHRKNA